MAGPKAVLLLLPLMNSEEIHSSGQIFFEKSDGTAAITPSKHEKFVKFWVSVDYAFTAIVDFLATQDDGSDETSIFKDFKVFAFRVPYGFEQEAVKVINSKAETVLEQLRRPEADCEKLLKGLAIAFTPIRRRTTSHRGRPTPNGKEFESVVPNVMFVLSTFDKARAISMCPLRKETANAKTISIMRAYYMRDHTKPLVERKFPPITITPRQMWSFMRLTSTHDSSVELLPPDFPIKEGGLYKVISGYFAGIVGYAQRVKGKDVMLVDLNSLGYIKSCYISRKLLLPVDEALYAPAPEPVEDVEHLTSRNIHTMPKAEGDPRRWFVLKTWNGRQYEAAATITYRQHCVIEAKRKNEPFAEDAYFGLGNWPVIAIAPYSRKWISKDKRPPRHIYLYATIEDAYALVRNPLKRGVAEDFPGERDLPLKFKTKTSEDGVELDTPIEIEYERMQNLILLTRSDKENVYKLPKDTEVDFDQPEVRLTTGLAAGVHGWLLPEEHPQVLVVNLLPAALLAYEFPEGSAFEPLTAETEEECEQVASSEL